MSFNIKKNLHFNWKCTYLKDFVKEHLYSDWKYAFLRILWRKNHYSKFKNILVFRILSRTICILIERYSYCEDFIRKNINLIWNCSYFFVKKHLYSDWNIYVLQGFFKKKISFLTAKYTFLRILSSQNFFFLEKNILTFTYNMHKNTAVTQNSSFAFEWAVSDFKIPTGSALIYSQVRSHVALTICSLTLPRIHTYHPWIMASTHTRAHTPVCTHTCILALMLLPSDDSVFVWFQQYFQPVQSLVQTHSRVWSEKCCSANTNSVDFYLEIFSQFYPQELVLSYNSWVHEEKHE